MDRPIRFLLLLCTLLLSTPAMAADCVILLHGLGRGSHSMDRIAAALETKGYHVWNRGYDSTAADVPALAELAIAPAVAHCAAYDSTHFVTHSLGGILVRVFFQERDFNGRIVMISPPNQGSELPDVLDELALFHRVLGPAAKQLGTDDLPPRLGPISGEIGVITGDRSSDPWFSWLIPGPDDGKVSVASARLDEMADFLVVHEGHSFIMLNREVIHQVGYFLANGEFEAEP